MVLQHLKTFIETNLWFKRILFFFAIQDAWISRLTRQLADGQESFYVDYKHYRFREILLSKHSLSQNKYYFNLYEFLKRRIHALVGKLKNRCFCWFPAAIFVPLKGTQTWRLHIKLYKSAVGKTFFWISRIWNIAQTRFLARLFVCLSSFISQILDFLY